jgi:uncharacterized protein (TIGR02145 family)/uncharacterized repeat protein (TIGR02543 family)
MNNLTKSGLLSILLLGMVITFFCDLPSDPSENYSNTDIVITSDSTSALTSLTTSFSIKLSFPNLIDSVIINYGDSTQPVKIPVKNNDSLMASQTNYSLSFKTSHLFLSNGEKTVVAIAYMSNLTKSSNVKLNIIKPAQFLPDSLIHVTGTLALNAPVSLSVHPEGTLPIHFAWYKNATVLAASDNAVYTIPSFQITDTGSYFCVVSNTKGVDTSAICKLQMGMILYSIQYNGNGNTGGTVPIDSTRYAAGNTVIIRSNTGLLTKAGAIFAGWNTLTDGTGTNYSADANLLIGNANVILYAKWTFNPTFTISYNGNGHTGGIIPVDGNSYETGLTATIKSNSGALIKTGFNFSGWSINPDGTGASFTGGESFTIGVSNVVLYAKWTSNPTFTITYNGNGNTGGTVPTDLNTYLTGNKAGIKPNTGNLVKAGYTFSGWNTSSDGSGTLFTSTDSIPVATANVILYAKWIPVFTITYSGNSNTGGAVPLDSNIYVTGAKAAIRGNLGNLSKTGLVFAGWNTSADGTGTQYSIGDSIPIGTSNVLLFAKWLLVYSVTYYGNSNTSGTVPVDNTLYTNGQTASVLDNTGILIRTGYSFAGWNTNASGTGTDRTPGSTFAIGSTNVSLYAKWTINQYTINYHSNGATAGTVSAPVTQNYQTTFTVAAQGNLLRTNYQFAGWNTKANATGTTYLSGSTFTIGASSDTLFAVWSPNRYTITFDAQGATNPANQDVIYPALTAGTLPVPVFTGCNFKGWWTTPFDTGTAGTQVVSTTPVGANVKVYARWTVTDVEGHEYKTVRIGNQTWMAENLKTTKFNDGTEITKATTENMWIHSSGVDTTALGRYCFVGFSADTSKNNFYGPVYNWHALDTTTIPKHVLAISGWHIPSDMEWDTLMIYLSANGYNYDNTITTNPDLATNKIAKALCAKTDWPVSSVAGAPGNDLNKNNKCGFYALPAGYAWCDGSFTGSGTTGVWWSSSDPLTMKNFRSLSNRPNMDTTAQFWLPEPKAKAYKDYGFSVRLVKNR